MTTYKKALIDKDGNYIIPDVGINLDDVVYGEDPTTSIDQIIDPNSYLTSETKTGGTWIDGKEIYKKTVNTGALPNNTSKTVAHNISNLDKVIKIEGFAFDSYDTYISLPLIATNAAYNVQIAVTLTDIVLTDGADRSNWTTSYTTIYYTKSS